MEITNAKIKIRVMVFIILSVLFLGSYSTTTLAANDDSIKISKVNLQLTHTVDKNNGGEIDVSINSTGTEYYVDDWEITNLPSNGVWGSNVQPLLKVYLVADDGYYFSSSSSSAFTITGGDFSSAKRTESNTYLEVSIKLKAVNAVLGTPSSLKWVNETTASWNSANSATSYQVILYRDGVSVNDQKVTATSLNLSSKMKTAGKYYFKVRSISSSGSSSSYATSVETVVKDNVVPDKGWKLDAIGWWYKKADNTYPTSSWLQVDNIWYYFNPEGYMVTGWKQLNSLWYYMNPSGAMQASCWVEYQGNWYYLSNNGEMLTNTTTPDGYQVDSNGIWIR